uniref:1-aminocyclopropane-1-carboxylate deaminase n=1 Tax=Rheinheimera sp. BAL341 TaxID=1708203 RepID=A0A486XH64_9GAMM
MDKKGIVTFGGAFSNHLAAVAAICQQQGMRSVALLRADNADPDNPTLALCQKNGMQFELLSRQQYRQRANPAFIREVKQRYAELLLVPEGGSSAEGVQGIAELDLVQTPAGPADVVFCPAASGGTAAGIINRTRDPTQVQAIAVVKDPSLGARITELLLPQHNPNWALLSQYCGPGYAKFEPSTLQFCRDMAQHDVQLEPIYSGKALAGVFQQIAAGQFEPGCRLSFFHTGGLQGLAGLHYRQLITSADYALLSGSSAY